MKKLFAATITLLALSWQAQAIQIDANIIDESLTHCTVEISWQLGLPINEPWWPNHDRRETVIDDTAIYHLAVRDELGGIKVEGGRSGYFGLDYFTLNIVFPDFPARWALEATITGDASVSILAQDRIRVVFGHPAVEVVGVPDAGSTAGLFGLAIGGLAFARRRFKA